MEARRINADQYATNKRVERARRRRERERDLRDHKALMARIVQPVPREPAGTVPLEVWMARQLERARVGVPEVAVRDKSLWP